MIQLSDIIKAIGGSEKEYPSANIRLFDGKGREVTSQSVAYAHPLFVENPSAKSRFENALEASLNTPCNEPVRIQIGVNSVVLNYKTPNARTFMRMRPLDPLDYME